jgi:hypothetical protein
MRHLYLPPEVSRPGTHLPRIDQEKIKREAVFDGKLVLTTNTKLGSSS